MEALLSKSLGGKNPVFIHLSMEVFIDFELG